MRKIAIGLAAVLALSGCAKRADSIAAAYVSPTPYMGLSCAQLSEEAKVISSRAQAASGAQDSKAGKDAAVTAVGLVVFWPALFFVGGDSATAAEVSRLKGEMQAIEDASRRKGCKIQFAPKPAPAKPGAKA
ncbi:hypothetical protein [Aureimonas sp. AU12]|uniref:hypothetical protein n=1 Tax=Aureimonas sp. AU12 TaxID=1638161 RepID=UPI0007835C3B|nr:hypothetical protein [Aureimonas sp. AU12]